MHIRSATGEFRFTDQRRPPRPPWICILHAVVLGIGLMATLGLGGDAVAANTGATYEQGRADRQALESWFAGLSGDFRAGADFWAGHRSTRKPPSCSAQGRSRQFVEGCDAAKARFDPSDIRRKAEPDYRDGWNSPLSSPSPSSTPAPNYRFNPDGLIAKSQPSGGNGFLAWLTWWPMIAGAIGAAAVLCWLWLNLPGARRVKMAWARVRPALCACGRCCQAQPRQAVDLEPDIGRRFRVHPPDRVRPEPGVVGGLHRRGRQPADGGIADDLGHARHHRHVLQARHLADRRLDLPHGELGAPYGKQLNAITVVCAPLAGLPQTAPKLHSALP